MPWLAAGDFAVRKNKTRLKERLMGAVACHRRRTRWMLVCEGPGAILNYPWVWPLCETLHFVGLALVIGVAGFFDLRLMGS